MSSQIPTDRLSTRLVQTAAVTAAGIGVAFLALCQQARVQAVVSLVGWVLAIGGIGWALRRRRVAEALAGFALFVGIFIQGFLWICPEGGLRAGTVLGVGGLLVFGLLIAAGGAGFAAWDGEETEFDRQLRTRPKVYPWSV